MLVLGENKQKPIPAILQLCRLLVFSRTLSSFPSFFFFLVLVKSHIPPTVLPPLPSILSSCLSSILSFPFCIYLFLRMILRFFILINLLLLYCRIVEPINCWLHEDQVSMMVESVSLLWSTSLSIDSFFFLGLIPYLSSCFYFFFFFLSVDSHLLAMEAQNTYAK